MMWMDQQEYKCGKKLSDVKRIGRVMKLHNWRVTKNTRVVLHKPLKLVMMWMDQQEYKCGKKLSDVKHIGYVMKLHNWRTM
ncbi:hypothetical protein RYX36_029473 [Vicia faba]